MRPFSFLTLTVAGAALLLTTPLSLTAQDEAAKDAPAEAAPEKEAAPAAAAETPSMKKPETLEERTGYFFGTMLGQQLASQGFEVDLDHVTAALNDALSGKEPVLSEDEMRATIEEAQKIATDKMAAELGKEGAAYLEENAKKEGVKVTESGLQYKVIEAGEGATPEATDEVTVHYKGTLIDGKQFDSSYDRGEPTSFPLNRVIPGWTEGLQLMNKGSKYEFYIPYDLAYGEKGAGQDIPPFATLKFVVELLKINGE